MKLDIESLKSYLAEHAWKESNGTVQMALDSLFWEYLDRNYVSSDVIREQTRKAEKYMSRLTEMETDDVISCFYLMCGEHQRLAFAAGTQAGARLVLELLE